jgi:hypothetical protein
MNAQLFALIVLAYSPDGQLQVGHQGPFLNAQACGVALVMHRAELQRRGYARPMVDAQCRSVEVPQEAAEAARRMIERQQGPGA